MPQRPPPVLWRSFIQRDHCNCLFPSGRIALTRSQKVSVHCVAQFAVNGETHWTICFKWATANVKSKVNFAFWQVIGKIYLTGGYIIGRGITNRAEVLDVSRPTCEIKALPPMTNSRKWHATTAAGPFVFAFGGVNEHHEKVSSCEFYDSRTNTWVQHISDYIRIKLKSCVHNLCASNV